MSYLTPRVALEQSGHHHHHRRRIKMQLVLAMI
jgi:hypothetical protein